MKYNQYQEKNYNLITIPINKFKTTLICFEFVLPYEKKDINKIKIILELLNIASKKYDNEIKLYRKIVDLCNVRLNTICSRVKDLAVFRIGFKYVNPEFSYEKIEDDIIEFAKEIIYNSAFEDEKIYNKHIDFIKKEIIQYEKDRIKDPKNRVFMEFDKKTYGNIPSNERIDINYLNKLSYQELKKYYNKLISKSYFNIYTCGNIDELEIVDKIKNGIKANNQVLKRSFDVTKKYNLKYCKNITENNGEETILYLAYTIKDDIDKVTRNILVSYMESTSGFIYQIVREKNSLCYNYDVSTNLFDNIIEITIPTKSQKDAEKSAKIIKKEIKKLTKEIDHELLEMIKNEMIEKCRTKYQYEYEIISDISRHILYNNELFEDRIEKIKEIKDEDIVNLAKSLELKREYISRSKL